MNKTLIKCTDVSYKNNDYSILEDINLEIPCNQITAIIGPNGSGKTSLLKILFGLIDKSSGTILRNFNQDDSSFIFQKHIFLNMTVFEVFNHALFCKDVPKQLRYQIVSEAINRYNIEHLKDKNVKLLSGGEQQIIALIRSLILKPKVLFYDEPLNDLDTHSSDYVVDILKELHAKKVQLLIVTHDVNLLDKLKCKIIMMNKGKIK